jgi:capsular polysaccharide biosynthesis protein
MGKRFNNFRNHAFPVVWEVLPRGVLRWLPGTSRSFGPPRRAASLAEYQRFAPVQWQEVFAARTDALPAPFFCNDPHTFANDRTVSWPATGVATIANGRVLDEHAWIVGNNDTFLGELCYLGNSRQSRANQIIKLHPPKTLPGRTLNLCSANAVTNFFHYVVDSVSRMELVRRAGFTWDDFDQILLPRFSSPTSREVDAAIQFPADKIIRIGRREQYLCETLIQPSFPGPVASTPPWVLDFYRKLFPTDVKTRGRKLFFPRKGNRHPRNGGEIEALMKARGFETIEPTATPDLRQRMSEATHIVAVHGACLANLIFCAPGTRVLEIMPTEISRYYNRAFYHTMCASGQMPYGAVIGQSPRHRLLPFSPQPKTEFDVKLSDLDAGVAALLGS